MARRDDMTFAGWATVVVVCMTVYGLVDRFLAFLENTRPKAVDEQLPSKPADDGAYPDPDGVYKSE